MRKLKFLVYILFCITLLMSCADEEVIVSFNTNGGNLIGALNAKDIELNDLPIPVRDGYTFLGWFLNEELDESIGKDTLFTSSLTLYAKWEVILNTYTITFESNGGSVVLPIVAIEGSTLTEPLSPSKTGYTFLGWFEDALFSVPASFDVMPNHNVTYYADWEINHYSIAFESNGGTLFDSMDLPYGTVISVYQLPEREGYTFDGWYLDEEFEESFDIDLMPDFNFTLYAKWEIVLNTYTLTFESNGGSVVLPIVAIEGSTLTEPLSPSKTGYTFLGWFEDALFNVPASFDMMPNHNVTYYADWEINHYSIAFESNGGTLFDPMDLPYGTVISVYQLPEREGYTFEGWYLDEEFEESFDIDLMPDSNFTLYAKWEVIINTYSITFESNGGTLFDVMELAYGTVISVYQLPEREGYTFDGWYLDEEFEEPFAIDLMPDFNFTLYAKWISESVTVSFDSQGGSEVSSISGIPGNPLIEPSVPTREGYTFSGWFENIEDINLYEFTTIPNDSITLYADWGTEGLAYELINDDTEYEVGIGDAYEFSTITIPKYYQGIKVTTIMEGGFTDADLMNVIHLPNTLTTINRLAFIRATSLSQISLPDRLEFIGYGAFMECHSLESLSVSNQNPTFETVDGVLFTKGLETLVRYPQAKIDTTYTISDAVRIIAETAFSHTYNLTSLDLGNGVTTIKTHALYQASSILSLVIPDQVTTIELYAFRECSSLQSITLGSGITAISSYMFDACVSLTSIVIPYGVTSIGYGAFYNCTSLRNIYVVRTSLNGLITGALFMFMYTPSDLKISFPDQMTVDAYKVATYWSSFASKMQIGTP